MAAVGHRIIGRNTLWLLLQGNQRDHMLVRSVPDEHAICLTIMHGLTMDYPE
jgi:hypothetical protein